MKLILMTLIACTFNYGHPFLISDTLITVDQFPQSIPIPVHHRDITQYLGEDARMPIALLQKSYVIAPNICVALAGKVYAMKRFLENLKIRCSYFDLIKSEHIEEFLREYQHDESYRDFAFIIPIIESYGQTSGRLGLFTHGNWIKEEDSNFEKVYAEGSGANQFVYQMKSPMQFEATAQKGQFQRALSTNFTLLAKFMAIERSTLITVKESWGAGFETIIYNGKTFEKLDRFAHVICEANYDEHGNMSFPLPKIVMYHFYVNNLLHIQSFSLSDWQITENSEFYYLHTKEFEWNSHQVGTLEMDVESEKAILAPFKTNKSAIGFNIIKNGKSIFAPSGFIENNQAHINYTPEEGMQVILSKEMLFKIREGAVAVYPNLD